MRANIFLALFIIFLQSLVYAVPEEINLPTPKLTGKIPLEEALAKRRSARSYYPNLLNNDQLSQLVWAAQGITDKIWGGRTAPSAGSIYPLEIYLANSEGIYRYDPQKHNLILSAKGDRRPNLTRGALGQSFISEAPVSLIITGTFEKTKEKYGGLRGFRYVLMEAGHSAQNVLLEAVALGLGAVPVGVFWDEAIQGSLGLPPDQVPLYIIPVGYPKE